MQIAIYVQNNEGIKFAFKSSTSYKGFDIFKKYQKNAWGSRSKKVILRTGDFLGNYLWGMQNLPHELELFENDQVSDNLWMWNFQWEGNIQGTIVVQINK